MPDESLSDTERTLLLKMARQAIELAVTGRPPVPPDLAQLPPRLREPGAVFVTLTLPGDVLRGCIGGLEAVQPLAQDVYEHAAAAALEDYRFPPVLPVELEDLRIEISRLTAPHTLEYDHPEDLVHLLHPHRDGVVLHNGQHRATFLPQVWDKLPDPHIFLSQLCQKMGAPGDLWRKKLLRVEVYHVEEFKEALTE